MELNKIKEVVVVEGYHDLAKLKAINKEIDIVITNGSEISQETLEELKALNKTRGLILFLDPDYQGERIRRLINDYVGPTKHAFLRKEQAINKNHTKVGIEHASDHDIMESLEKVYTAYQAETNISIQTLYSLGLIGKPNSKQLRKKVCDSLNIGLSNGKTLVNKLNMFGITIEKLKDLLEV
jgi:ribonuclease M5